MAIIFGLKLNGEVWNNYSWVSKTGEVPSNFYDSIGDNDDFDMDLYLESEKFEREISDVEVENYEHLEWYG